MSWSFNKTGKAADVLASAQETLTNYKCAEPEQTIKGKALELLASALGNFPADSAQDVKVDAYGSQSTSNGSTAINTLKVEISIPTA